MTLSEALTFPVSQMTATELHEARGLCGADKLETRQRNPLHRISDYLRERNARLDAINGEEGRRQQRSKT